VIDRLDLGGAIVTLRRHVLAFFQGNRHLLRDLVIHVTTQVPRDRPLIDLYAGVGVFAVSAAVSRGVDVTAVEGDRSAAADLDANAKGIGAVRSVHDSVERFVSGVRVQADGLQPDPHQPDHAPTLIVDPPRTGMSREALDGALRVNAARIIYVSCDVATLARDARRIVDRGYTIVRADAFDLFPNTPHVETVVVLDRS
jgi:23S rRNA (uracil1939-C5)-methyltransferase